MINLSAEPTNKLYSWLPHDLEAEEIVLFPDACPGKSPLPTGTSVRTRQTDWRKFAVSDVGCGMRLLRSNRHAIQLEQWNDVAGLLKANKGQLGDLGGGNHFLDALLPYSEDRLYFLIHTGSRQESGLVDAYVEKPDEFDAIFDHTLRWARANRAGVQEVLEKILGPMEVVLDLPHNTYEKQADGSVIIRKGTVKVQPGELNVIPSNLDGEIALVKATNQVATVLNSLSHGTGRIMSRGDSKKFALDYDFAGLRQRVIMPDCLQDASLRTEGPYAYRDLEACLALLDGYVEEIERYAIIAYMGHL
jgi:hypothetical protein